MSFEHLSFIDIFEEKQIDKDNNVIINGQNLSVEIPMLQRDYAYGRLTESTTEKRKTFLRSIKGYLESGVANHELDFVYGSTKEINGEKILTLLDGQQRITTLFLLHWYFAKCSSNEDYNDFKNLLSKNGVSRFRYATRESSTAFCNELVQCGNCLGLAFLDDKDKPILSKTPSISLRIRNEKWFFNHWSNDPTVVNMLNMLDDIERFFPKEQAGKYYQLLAMSGKKSCITFNFLPFDEYGLTDELYIKMNSRGKPLTRFENLKSKILKSLDFLKDTDRAKKILSEVNKQKTEGKPYESLRDYVSLMMDTKWTDVFWNFWLETKEEYETVPCIDDMMLSFISTFCIQYEIIRIGDGQLSISKNSDESKEIDKLMQARNNISYDDLILILTINKTCSDLLYTYNDEKIINLIKSMKQDSSYDCILFDLILSLDNISDFSSKKWNLRRYSNSCFNDYYDENRNFKTIVYEFRANDKKARFYEEKFFFFGYLNYLLKYSANLDTGLFEEWIFFVYNLAKNSYLLTNASYTYATCILGLNEIISYNIYDELKNKNTTIAKLVSLDENQLQEEVLKSYLFENKIWKQTIFEASKKLEYFEGHLYYSLINQCGITNADINNNDAISRYQIFIEKLSAIFPNKKGCSVENALIRALLSVGDYSVQVGNVKSYSLFQNDGRDISWKRLIKNQDSKTNIFSSVINDPSFNKDDVETSLVEIAEKNKPLVTENWRRIIIENPEMIDYLGANRYLRWNETNKNHQNSEKNWDNWEINLLKTSVIFGKHYEIFSYALNSKLSSIMNNLSCFSKKEYLESRTENHETEIKLVGWNEGKGSYYMYIKYADNNKYKISFTYYEQDNETIPNQKVKSVLENYGYSETNTIYSKLWDEKEIVQHLINISKDFELAASLEK